MTTAASEFEVVLLAAGCSRRLAHLTREVPKAFLPVGGRRILDYGLDALERLGFERVTAIVGYRAEVYRHAVGEARGGLRVRYVDAPEYATTGHGYSFYGARHELLSEGRPVLLLHADVVFDPRIVARVLASPHADVLAVDEAFEVRTGDEVVVCGAQDRVTGIRKYVEGPDDVLGEVVGVNKWSSAFVASLLAFMDRYFAEHGRDHNWEAVVDAFLASGGGPLHAVPIGGFGWVNVNHQEDLALAEAVVRGVPR